MHVGETKRRRVPWLRHPPQFVERRQRLSAPARRLERLLVPPPPGQIRRISADGSLVVRVQLDGAPEMAIGCTPVPVVIGQDERQRSVRSASLPSSAIAFSAGALASGYASLMGRKPASLASCTYRPGHCRQVRRNRPGRWLSENAPWPFRNFRQYPRHAPWSQLGMALRPPSPGRIPIPCPRCGMRVKLTGERERLVYYICESCGTRGHSSLARRISEFQ